MKALLIFLAASTLFLPGNLLASEAKSPSQSVEVRPRTYPTPADAERMRQQATRPELAAAFIPAKEFNVLGYGAKADGTTLNSRPIQAAIDAAAAAGGGHVIIPSGQFLCGPILLKNNIDLHLDKGAVLQMSRNFDDFPVRGNDRQAFILAATLLFACTGRPLRP